MPVYKNKDKHWYFVVTVNYKQYKRVKWNGHYMMSKAEAQAAEQEFLKQFIGYNDNPTLLELFKEYVEASKSSLKASTRYNYEKFEKNYLALIQNKKITDLTPGDILIWRNFLSDTDLSIPYKNRLQKIMKNLLEYGSIMYNLNGKLQYSLMQPFKDNDVKELNTKTKYLENEKFKKLIEPLDSKNYYYIVLWTLYYTGLRIGELAALTKNDIKNNYIIVNKDYSRVKGKDIIQAPKNQNSIRKVPLDKATSEMLQEFISNKNKNDIVFHQQSKYLNQQKLRRMISKLQAEAGLDGYEITPHTLRHSYSSNLKMLGYDEYTISKLMGNTPKVAASTYIHTNIDFEEVSEKLKNIG
ncbi:MAG: site-specific integrase [Acholeplasmatales bacterium]|nr:site-specific integrase [Acholeplasmatales bacterium]